MRFFPFTTVNFSTMNYLSIIGLCYILYLLYRFVSFLILYLSTFPIDDYLTGESPYAIVTGASDGIGKGVAKELYLRGFNLILHGRNPEKTQKAVEEIRALRHGKEQRDIHVFLADASRNDHDFQKMIAQFKDLNVSLLINNAGGSLDIISERIDEWPASRVFTIFNTNSLFHLGLIHAILPQFRKRRGKCLVANVGSFSAEIPPPRTAVYAACKQFLKTLTWSLSVDERYYTPTNIRFIYLVVGQVQTSALKKSPNLIRPDADTFGRAIVNRLACGRIEVTPYAPHAMSQLSALMLGNKLGEWVVAQAMKELFKKEIGNKKKD